MLIGIPAVGKTTFTESFSKRTLLKHISTDLLIEQWAQERNTTYEALWPTWIQHATNCAIAEANDAIRRGEDFLWDQTNLTVKSRRPKLQNIPNSYIKHAVVFYADAKTDRSLIDQRIASRKGKHIPPEVIDRMFRDFTMPSLSEGFDFIRIINVRDQILK